MITLGRPKTGAIIEGWHLQITRKNAASEARNKVQDALERHQGTGKDVERIAGSKVRGISVAATPPRGFRRL